MLRLTPQHDVLQHPANDIYGAAPCKWVPDRVRDDRDTPSHKKTVNVGDDPPPLSPLPPGEGRPKKNSPGEGRRRRCHSGLRPGIHCEVILNPSLRSRINSVKNLKATSSIRKRCFGWRLSMTFCNIRQMTFMAQRPANGSRIRSGTTGETHPQHTDNTGDNLRPGLSY